MTDREKEELREEIDKIIWERDWKADDCFLSMAKDIIDYIEKNYEKKTNIMTMPD